ncbi:hypothetical protein Taro_053961 [Colocasia esculenta]|uniref:Amine oxidase domain-containing protein n=1 Tax=Colocasia esculenta TaxID=4460 RepID=A0A843XP32_COLES|nr:hypothetical protein [Colocasia esculenta]
MAPTVVTLLLATILVAFNSCGEVTARPAVIVVGAGMSGISAAKTLSEAGIKNILILEATDRIGGRMHKVQFGGLNVEMGANWVEGVNGQEVNPIWTMAKKLKLRTFYSDYSNLSSNIYQQTDGLYKSSIAQVAVERAENNSDAGADFSKTLAPSGLDDISVLSFQRLQQHVPSTPLDMVVDYYSYDYEFAEPPRVTSLQNTQPLPTFANFGEDVYFVADQRGYESVVYDLAGQFLVTDGRGNIVDPRLKLGKVSYQTRGKKGQQTCKSPEHRYVTRIACNANGYITLQVVREISYSKGGVIVKTEDGTTYASDYVMVSASVGVLQTELIKFQPDLPAWKILAIYQFDMAIYTKIFLKFPYTFWPTGKGTEFFLYATGKRGYYPVWQQFEAQYPDANVLLVTVTDDESRRIEQQPDNVTKAEAMQVLRNMFGKNIPEATDILVPKWWSNRFYKGTFSNWPIGVNKYEYDQIRSSNFLFNEKRHLWEEFTSPESTRANIIMVMFTVLSSQVEDAVLILYFINKHASGALKLDFQHGSGRFDFNGIAFPNFLS